MKAFIKDVALPYEGDECLRWPFGNVRGYGTINIDGRKQLVSRVICEMVNGPPPTPQHQAAHSCGNGHLGCVTKRHLRWATPKENAADSLRHGTIVRGVDHYQAKLTVPQVQAIRSMDLPVRKIAAMFGVTQGAICKIKARQTWASVPEA